MGRFLLLVCLAVFASVSALLNLVSLDALLIITAIFIYSIGEEK